MLKKVNSHCIYFRQKRLNFMIIALILFLLAISPVAASFSNPKIFLSHEKEPIQVHISAETLGDVKDSRDVFAQDKNPNFLEKIKQYVITYMLGLIGTVLVIFLIYPRILRRINNMIVYLPKAFSLVITKKVSLTEDSYLEKVENNRIRFWTLIPFLFIVFGEFLIYSGRIGAALWVHIVTLIVLSFSNIFIKDSEIHKIHQALILLPILRLTNLSVPIFSITTLYSFVFVYGSMIIPVAFIVIHQRTSFEEMGIMAKNLMLYIIIAIPLSFLLGLGEYLTIRPGYLIPNLTFQNLLMLTFIMVFFVGFTEELIFRTILQTRLENVLSIKESLIITSILFGIMHSGYGTFYEILYTSFVGFFMGFVFYKTKNLPFIAFLHGFTNVFLFGILPHHPAMLAWFLPY